MDKISQISTETSTIVSIGHHTSILHINKPNLVSIEEIESQITQLKTEASKLRKKGIKVSVLGINKAIEQVKLYHAEALEKVNKGVEFYNKAKEQVSSIIDKDYKSKEQTEFVEELQKEYNKNFQQLFYNSEKGKRINNFSFDLKNSILDLQFASETTIKIKLNFHF